MAIVSVFLLKLRNQGQNYFSPTLSETLGTLKLSLECNSCKLIAAQSIPSSHSQEKSARNYFNDCTGVFFLPWTPTSNSLGWIFECVASLIESSCLSCPSSCSLQRSNATLWEQALALLRQLHSCFPIQFGSYYQSVSAGPPTRGKP